jgi:hypothetical protein
MADPPNTLEDVYRRVDAIEPDADGHMHWTRKDGIIGYCMAHPDQIERWANCRLFSSRHGPSRHFSALQNLVAIGA